MHFLIGRLICLDSWVDILFTGAREAFLEQYISGILPVVRRGSSGPARVLLEFRRCQLNKSLSDHLICFGMENLVCLIDRFSSN